MKFTKNFRGTNKKLHRTEYMMVDAKDYYIKPKLDFLSSTSVWHIDEFIKKKTRDWMHLIHEDGYSNIREDAFNKDIEVYTGTYSVFSIPLMEMILLRYGGEPGRKILDAFAGGPSRGFTSSVMGYEYYGVDLSKKQIKSNRKRIKKLKLKNIRYKLGDATHMSEYYDEDTFDIGISCPPYFDLEVYSDNPNDLSRSETYSDFDDAMFFVAEEYAKLLKPGSFMCIVVGNFRDKKTKELIDFRTDTVLNFRKAGFLFHQDIVLVKNFGSAATRAGNSWRGQKLVPRHEYLLVFKLPDEEPKKKRVRL